MGRQTGNPVEFRNGPAAVTENRKGSPFFAAIVAARCDEKAGQSWTRKSEDLPTPGAWQTARDSCHLMCQTFRTSAIFRRQHPRLAPKCRRPIAQDARSVAMSPSRVHADRAVGVHRHHWDPGRRCCCRQFRPHGRPPRTAECKNNLKQNTLAVQMYHDVHRVLPVAMLPGYPEVRDVVWRSGLLRPTTWTSPRG